MSDVAPDTPAVADPLPISVAAVSETGQREQNQDCMSAFPSAFGAVYLIADGMGGHRGGAQASRLVVDSFQRHLLAASQSLPARDALTLAVRLANVEVLEQGKGGNPELAGMGSTVVIALVRAAADGLELITAHVGDSRAYLFRKGILTLLTKDHTQVQWLIDNNELDEVSARNHPGASILTRAMGHTADLQVDVSGPIPLFEDDEILLCSDGLSGFAVGDEIRKTLLQSAGPTESAGRLVQLALASGSSDNITVQLLRVGRFGPASAPSISAAPKTTAVEFSRGLPRRHPLYRILLILASLAVLAFAGWLTRYSLFSSVPSPAHLQQRLSNAGDLNQRALQTALGGQARVDRDGKTAGCTNDHPTTICTLVSRYSSEVADFERLGTSLDSLKKQIDAIAAHPSSARRRQLVAFRDQIDRLETQINREKTTLDGLEQQRKSLGTPMPVAESSAASTKQKLTGPVSSPASHAKSSAPAKPSLSPGLDRNKPPGSLTPHSQ
ncbi:MAG TPA: protein phosphatase 2C domain-containing protein [Acidobacteriaceae bacterium]